jgi:hypothetical protein
MILMCSRYGNFSHSLTHTSRLGVYRPLSVVYCDSSRPSVG